MRVKTDFQETEGPGGKKRMQKVGLKADQRDNTEYEFDMVLRFEAGNECHVEKVRGCSAMNGKSTTRPGPAFWKPLFDWWKAGDDAAPPPQPQQQPAPQPPAGDKALCDDLCRQLLDAGTPDEKKTIMASAAAAKQSGQLTDAQLTVVRTAALAADIKFANTGEAMDRVVADITRAAADGRISDKQADALMGKVAQRTGNS